MTRGLGFNIHLSYVSDDHWAALLDRFKLSPPAGLLLLDSFGSTNPEAAAKAEARAIEAALRLPNTLIVFRRYFENPADGTGDNNQTFLSPQQWVAQHIRFRYTRVYCSANNEPGMQASAPWLLEVALAAKAAGLKVSLGGWAVGSYTEADLPALEPLLRYTAINPGLAVYDFHEYCRGLVVCDIARNEYSPDRWPRTVEPQALHLMGRYKRVLKYAEQLGISKPRIVIGEWGFDRVRAVPDNVYGDVGGLTTLGALWASRGYPDAGAYASAQLRWANEVIYTEPEVLAHCFYQLSDQGSGNWPEFNASSSASFMAETREGFNRMTTPTPPTVPAVQPYEPGEYTLSSNQSYINLRSFTGADIGDIRPGDRVTVVSSDLITIRVLGVSYQAQAVRVAGLGGYLALTGSFTLLKVANKAELIAEARALLARLEAIISALEADT